MARFILLFTGILLMGGCAHDKKQRAWNHALERAQQFTLYPIKQPSEYTSSTLTRNIAGLTHNTQRFDLMI